ncbi:MAG TPA: hypothetical protein ENI55_02110 [Alphaproteobacteria bacterium]|nr:hypothetical protein [Alphaproteobacteria bacterium]
MIRTTTLLFLLLAAALSLALFSVKYRVQGLEGKITGLNRAIINDRKAIHVLRAEWSYLNNPDRLGDQARRYLGLAPVSAEQIVKIANIPERKDLLPRPARLTAPISLAKGAAPVSMKAALAEGGR